MTVRSGTRVEAVLIAVCEDGPTTAPEIAADLGVQRERVWSALARLEERGLVRRVPRGAPRNTDLLPTRKGRDWFRRLAFRLRGGSP